MVIDFKVYCMHAYLFVFKSNSIYILEYRKTLLTRYAHMKYQRLGVGLNSSKVMSNIQVCCSRHATYRD